MDEKAPKQQPLLDLLHDGVGADDDRAILSEEALGQEEESQFEAATREIASPAGKDDGFENDRRILNEMTKIAESARGEPDARVRHLADWIRKNICPGLPPLGEEPGSVRPPKWNETRVILFTEYDDTKRYLFQQLSAAIAGTDRADERIMIYHGPTPIPKREEIKRAFNEDPKKHPVRILIATDAAREGLNLQSHCQHLFHFDVPWNPARMEQRNGRIDRKLQPKPEVFCHYFVYVQRPEDRILKKLVTKSKTIKEELGSLAQVVEDRLAVLMKHGIARSEIERLEKEIDGANPDDEAKETAAAELEESRERQEALLEQIASLRKGLDHSRKWVGLNEDQFRAAISASLSLMKAPPLKRMDGGDDREGEPDRWVFPALDRRHGADATWTSTLDTLRERRKEDQKFWEWRREAGVRPVVFEDPGRIDESVVHLHLEHRVVQRLLARFRTQGFVRHDLSRACLAQSSDSIPRVALLGRLCLFGPGGTRLHEELVSVSAEWTETAKRKDGLRAYKRDAHQRTHELLFETLARPGKEVGEVVQKRLLASVEGDVDDLLGPLEEVGEEKRAAAEEALGERGRREAKEMKEILQNQRKRVIAEMERRNLLQQEFDFLPEEERKQVDAERRAQEKRLPAIDRELKTEPARIEKAYEVQTSRIEPVGIVYLWPATG